MHESSCTLPACYQPALLLSLPIDTLNLPGQNPVLSTGKGAHKKAWAGDTGGLPFLSVTETRCPARTLDPPSHCVQFPQHSSLLGCC